MKAKRPRCLGFADTWDIRHRTYAEVTLHIGAGTRHAAQIPLCDICVQHPTVQTLLKQPSVSLA